MAGGGQSWCGGRTAAGRDPPRRSLTNEPDGLMKRSATAVCSTARLSPSTRTAARPERFIQPSSAIRTVTVWRPRRTGHLNAPSPQHPSPMTLFGATGRTSPAADRVTNGPGAAGSGVRRSAGVASRRRCSSPSSGSSSGSGSLWAWPWRTLRSAPGCLPGWRNGSERTAERASSIGSRTSGTATTARRWAADLRRVRSADRPGRAPSRRA